MGKFNLGDYESVKQRKFRFFQDYPQGIIVPHIHSSLDDLMDYVVIRTEIYRNREDYKNKVPLSQGFALEIRDKEMKKSSTGKQYESVNYTSWIENCEESSIGRALDNAGYASNMKCSREEIDKAIRNKEILMRRDEQLSLLIETAKNKNVSNDTISELIKQRYEKDKSSQMDILEIKDLIEHISKEIK